MTFNSKSVQRTFVIGDEWLYYKIYSGVKTADLILKEIINPITQRLLSNKIIDKWFFIRYSDPQLHLRVRFHLTKKDNISEVIKIINNYTKPYIAQNQIWKIQVDTYQRELERYGNNTMELSENLFFHDSSMIVNMLNFINGDEGENIRWQFCLRAIDSFLDDFHYNIEQKKELMKVYIDYFSNEFNINKDARMNLGRKYTKVKQSVIETLDHSKDDTIKIQPLFKLIEEKSSAIQNITDELITLNNNNNLHIPLNDLINSYTHMLCNRLFKSKQRLHELVIYDFLHKYYESEIAKRAINKK